MGMEGESQRAGQLRRAFSQAFGASPQVLVRAPGRVNLIGEHTDYNEGFVLPVAIDRAIYIAARARADRRVRLVALDMGQRTEFTLDAIVRDETAPWSNYVRGVALFLEQAGYALRGLDGVIRGDVPRGAGLSSSAALEMAAALAFQVTSGLALDRVQMALVGRRAENEFVGVQTGIMDQFVSALGRRDHALWIDCRSLEYRLVPLPADVRIVVADSGVRRGLVASAYNQRRAECEEGVRRLAERLPGIRALRDVSVAAFEAHKDVLPQPVRRRVQHVVYENRRVLDAVAALEHGDLAAMGRLMDASHASLRDLYQVSGPELDALVEIARSVPGCLGARLTGAGFGGCTVNLVEQHAVPAVVAAIERDYPARTGRTPRVYICRAVDGAGQVAD
jgi:galactokinase